MLDQLGLGILLTLEDNFTPNANTAVNSMLRLEGQADQLANNVQRSLSNLQNVMLSGFSLVQIGSEFDALGQKVTGAFAGMFKQIAKAGSEMETLQAQFKTVFGNQAKSKLEWALDLAIKTPFEIKDVAGAMQRMGSQGLDVSKQFKNANGELKTFMQFMGDLASRNMGATGGFEGMGYAISEAWAGQFKSLQNRFNFSSKDLAKVRKDAGKNLEAFMQDIVDLSNKYTPNAMQNLYGTWEQTLSNMDDAWFKFMYKIGDKEGGKDVFGDMKHTLGAVGMFLDKISSSESTLNTLRNLFSSLWKPVNACVEGLLKMGDAILRFSEAHPHLASFLAKLTAISGIVLIVTGKFMKLTGSIMVFTASLVSAYANLTILKSMHIGKDIMSISKGLGGLVGTLKYATLAVGFFALAWKLNLGHIHEKVKSLGDSFNRVKKYAKDALTVPSNNFLATMDKSSKGLSSTEVKLGALIARTKVMGMLISDTYFGTKKLADYLNNTHIDLVKRFGLANFKIVLEQSKVVAKELWHGFKEGMDIAVKCTIEGLKAIFAPFKLLFDGLTVMFPQLGLSADQTKSKMEQLGHVFKKLGKIAGVVLGGIMGFKLIKGLTKVLTSPFDALLRKLKNVGIVAKQTFGKLTPFNKFNTKGYEKIMKTRETISGLTGRKFDEKQFRKMGLGLTGGQSRAGVRRNRNIVRKATGRDFSDKQFRAMGLYYDRKHFRMNNPFKGFRGKINKTKDSMDKFYKTLRGYTELDKYNVHEKYGSKFHKMNFKGDSDFEDNVLAGQKGFKGSNSMHVKKRNILSRLMFGDKFYSKQEDGSFSYLAQRGGMLTRRRDDKQLALASQLRGVQMNKPQDFKSFKAYRKYLREALFLETPKGKTGMLGDGALGGKLKQISSERGMLRNQSEQIKAQMLARKSYIDKNLGKFIGKSDFSQAKFNRWDSTEVRAKKQTLRSGLVNKVLSKDESYLGLKHQVTQNQDRYRQLGRIGQGLQSRHSMYKEDADSRLYKKSRNRLTDYLFGEKYYNIKQDKKGRYYENEVARRGGLFRNQKDNLMYNPKGDTSLAGRFGKMKNALGSSLMKGVLKTDEIIPKVTPMIKGAITRPFKAMGKSLRNLDVSLQDLGAKTTFKNMGRSLTNKLGKFKNSLMLTADVLNDDFGKPTKRLMQGFGRHLKGRFRQQLGEIRAYGDTEGASALGLIFRGYGRVFKDIGKGASKIGKYAYNNLGLKDVHQDVRKGMFKIKDSYHRFATRLNDQASYMKNNLLTGFNMTKAGKLTNKYRNSNFHKKSSQARHFVGKRFAYLGDGLAEDFMERVGRTKGKAQLIGSKFMRHFRSPYVPNARLPIAENTQLPPSRFGKARNALMTRFNSSSKAMYSKMQGALDRLNIRVGSRFSRIISKVAPRFSPLMNKIRPPFIKMKNILGAKSSALLGTLSSAFNYKNMKSRLSRGKGFIGNYLGAMKSVIPDTFRGTKGLLSKGRSKTKNGFMGFLDKNLPNLAIGTRRASARMGRVVNPVRERVSSSMGNLFSNLSHPLSYHRTMRRTREGRGINFANKPILRHIPFIKPFNSLVNKMPKFGKAFGGLSSQLEKGAIWAKKGAKATGFVGRGVWGTAKLGAKTARFGARAGMRGIGMAGRGAGMLARGALGAIPYVGLALMAGGAIKSGLSSRGAGLSGARRNALVQEQGAKGRKLNGKSDIQMGLADISNKLNHFDFKTFWGNFKKQGSNIFPLIMDILKSSFHIVVDNFPTIWHDCMTAMKQALAESLPMMQELAGNIWEGLKTGMSNFIEVGLPMLGEAFGNIFNWICENGIPLISDGFSNFGDFVSNTVIPWLGEAMKTFINWAITEGIPNLVTGFFEFIGSVVEHLPEILATMVEILGAIGLELLKLAGWVISQVPTWAGQCATFIWDGITACFNNLVDWIKEKLSGIFSSAMYAVLPDGWADKACEFLGIPKHHGGIYMSPDEHVAIVQQGETILPRGKSKKLDDLLEGRTGGNDPRVLPSVKSIVSAEDLVSSKRNTKASPSQQNHTQNTTIKIDRVEINVQADSLSRKDARAQALMILDELKKLNKEKGVVALA